MYDQVRFFNRSWWKRSCGHKASQPMSMQTPVACWGAGNKAAQPKSSRMHHPFNGLDLALRLPCHRSRISATEDSSVPNIDKKPVNWHLGSRRHEPTFAWHLQRCKKWLQGAMFLREASFQVQPWLQWCITACAVAPRTMTQFNVWGQGATGYGSCKPFASKRRGSRWRTDAAGFGAIHRCYIKLMLRVSRVLVECQVKIMLTCEIRVKMPHIKTCR